LAASVRAALDATLEQADAAIVLEDDCVVRPGGIEFFRQGLDAYRRDPRVRSVCGYLYPCPFVRHGREPLLLRRFSSWGWATWRDRWRTHDPNLTRVLARLAATGIRLEDVAGDLAVLCSSPKYLANGVDAWSVSWALEHFATGSFAVYPPESMVDNIGFDGTGQHCRRTRAFANAGTGRSCPPSWDWERPVHRPENDDLLRQFMARHGSDIYPDV
jgi:hypothetical protein